MSIRADVALRGGLVYDRPVIARALSEMVEATGGWPDSMSRGCRVLLKVNMLAAKDPGRGITTHPGVVAALAELLRRRGCSVAIGDSPGGAIKGVRRYWEKCGYLELSEELGLDLVNFESSGSVSRVSDGFEYHLAKPLFEHDAVVNMCKLKTHMYCGLTNAVKNMFGAVPGLSKAILHSVAVRPRDLAGHIVSIYRLVPCDLVVMDAILSLDGRGPSTDGRAREDGVLGVARDGVCMDLVASAMVGMDPLELDTNAEALRRGLGKEPSEIRVDGEVVVEPFDIPDNRLYNMIPPFLGSLVRPFLKRIPRSNENCTACGLCARSCPVGAITIAGGRARMSRRKCILCLCCHELCPENAVVVRAPFGRS